MQIFPRIILSDKIPTTSQEGPTPASSFPFLGFRKRRQTAKKQTTKRPTSESKYLKSKFNAIATNRLAFLASRNIGDSQILAN